MTSSEGNPNLPRTPPSQLAIHRDHPSNHSGSAMKTEHKHIWVITGPAGCGKTSVAEHLQKTFSVPYLEGDTFHPPENVAKMAAGHPLTDADRWDWLILLREKALETVRHETASQNVIVTCSALKRKYRDVVRIANYHDDSIQIHFVFLRASESVLMDRVRARQNHYMKDSMVHSQFQSLEVPQSDESDVLSIDASGTSIEVQHLAAAAMEKILTEDAVHAE